MLSKLLILSLFIGIIQCSATEQKIVKNESTEPRAYQFGYEINDGYNNKQYFKENSDSSNVKTGSYGYVDATGIYRTVNYVADEKGFRVVIKSNEPGLGNQKQIKKLSNLESNTFDSEKNNENINSNSKATYSTKTSKSIYVTPVQKSVESQIKEDDKTNYEVKQEQPVVSQAPESQKKEEQVNQQVYEEQTYENQSNDNQEVEHSYEDNQSNDKQSSVEKTQENISYNQPIVEQNSQVPQNEYSDKQVVENEKVVINNYDNQQKYYQTKAEALNQYLKQFKQLDEVKHQKPAVYPITATYPISTTYTTSQNYPTNSNYAVNSNYPASKSYPVNSNYPTSSNYPANSNYQSNSNYPVNSNYPASSIYPVVKTSNYNLESFVKNNENYPVFSLQVSQPENAYEQKQNYVKQNYHKQANKNFDVYESLRRCRAKNRNQAKIQNIPQFKLLSNFVPYIHQMKHYETSSFKPSNLNNNNYQQKQSKSKQYNFPENTKYNIVGVTLKQLRKLPYKMIKLTALDLPKHIEKEFIEKQISLEDQAADLSEMYQTEKPVYSKKTQKKNSEKHIGSVYY